MYKKMILGYLEDTLEYVNKISFDDDISKKDMIAIGCVLGRIDYLVDFLQDLVEEEENND